jgi:hypothetical protein
MAGPEHIKALPEGTISEIRSIRSFIPAILCHQPLVQVIKKNAVYTSLRKNPKANGQCGVFLMSE